MPVTLCRGPVRQRLPGLEVLRVEIEVGALQVDHLVRKRGLDPQVEAHDPRLRDVLELEDEDLPRGDAGADQVIVVAEEYGAFQPDVLPREGGGADLGGPGPLSHEVGVRDHLDSVLDGGHELLDRAWRAIPAGDRGADAELLRGEVDGAELRVDRQLGLGPGRRVRIEPCAKGGAEAIAEADLVLDEEGEVRNARIAGEAGADGSVRSVNADRGRVGATAGLEGEGSRRAAPWWPSASPGCRGSRSRWSSSSGTG